VQDNTNTEHHKSGLEQDGLGKPWRLNLKF